MKSSITLAAIALAASMGSFSLHAADVLSDDAVTVTGTISAPSDPTASYSKTETVPLTVKSVLQLLGPIAVSSKDVKFFYDQTAYTFVLASKDKATIYATLMSYQDSYVSWNTDAKKSFTGAASVKSLDTLTGTDRYQVTYLKSNQHYISTDDFTAFGTYNSHTLILKAKIKQLH